MKIILFVLTFAEFYVIFYKNSVDNTTLSSYNIKVFCGSEVLNPVQNIETLENAPLAQLVEHLTLNQGVPGSNP